MQSQAASRRGTPSCATGLAAALVVLIGVALAALTGAADAAATGGAGQGLRVTVAGTVGSPALELTNQSAGDCQIADMTTGLVRFPTVEQQGRPIAPALVDTYLADRIDRFTADRLVTLAAGQSRTIALATVSGDDGAGLIALSAEADGSAIESVYPLDSAQPLRLAAEYVLPVFPPGDVPLCSMAGEAPSPSTLSVRAGSDDTAGGLTLRLVGGAVALLLLVIALFLALRRRGSRGTGGPASAGGSAAIAVILVAGLVVAVARAPQARADYEPTASASSAFAACLAKFRAPGGDPAGVLGALDGKRVVISGVKGESYTTYGGGTVFVNWDSADTHAYTGGGSAESCGTLYHEMFHGSQLVAGTLNAADCWAPGPFGDLYDTGIRTSEVEAVRAQNQYRQSQGLPPRSTYGDSPLPPGPCQPPPDDANDRSEMCRDGGFGCGATNGDPHLTTFDGAHYDFQAAGEFVLTDDERGGFQVQVRQEPLAGSTLVALTTAAAMDVAGTRVAVGLGGALLINGAAVAERSTALPGGGSVEVAPGRRGPLFTVTWPDGSMVQVSEIASYGLLVTVRPAAERMGYLRGLLGNFDRDAANDIAAGNGTVIPAPPDFDALYPSFADSWRITQAGSLLGYAPGTSTGTFTIRPFPTRATTLDDVPNAAAARAACVAAGVSDPQALADCVLDVGLTGSTAFADAIAAASPSTPYGSIAIDGPEAKVAAGSSEPAVLSFSAAAGQQIYVEVTSTTLPDQCGVLTVRAPNGAEVASGCLIGGGGSVDRVELSAAGEYTLSIVPRLGSGSVAVRIVGSTSAADQLTPGGSPVRATVATAGSQVSYGFAAAAGTRVFVSVTDSDFPDQCGIVDVLGPDGVTLNFGCVTQGEGFVDSTLLPTSGAYTVVVDPDGAATGAMTLQLLDVNDQTGSIEVNGSPQGVSLTGPGAVASFTFDGSAGQTVSAAATGSTFPDQCSILQILAANGAAVATGCATGGTGSIDGATLPAAGTYRVVVDPYGVDTGTMRIRLTG